MGNLLKWELKRLNERIFLDSFLKESTVRSIRCFLLNLFNRKMLKKGFCSRKSGFYGITRLSSRGQIVLPKNLRDVLGVEEGDAFFVISNKAESGIILLKEDSVENFFDKLRERG